MSLKQISSVSLAALILWGGSIACAQNTSVEEAAPIFVEVKTPPQEGIMMNFQDAPLSAVLDYLSETAGFVILKQTTIRGTISIMNRTPITPDEAVSLLNTVLKEKGYSAIALGKTLKIVSISEAKKMEIPVRTGNDPLKIIPSDRIVTQIIPVMQVDATRLRQDLTPLIPTYAELTANASSNSLILTDTEANIRRVVEIVRALDSALSSVTEVKVFPLKYADATKTATLIETLFKPTDQAQGTGRVVGTFFGAGARRPGQAAQTPDQSQSQRTSAKVTASADTRTNTLVVSAPPETLKVIEEVVEKLDASNEATQAVFVYPLKNGDAANLQVTLNNLFGTSTATGTAARTTASRTTTGRTTTAGRTTATGTTARATSTRANISLSPGDTESLYGQVYIVADIDTNSLMVMTASKNFDRVKEIIAELDRAVPQVLIKVLIAEVTLDKSFDLGTEFSILDFGADTYGQKIDTKFGLVDMQGGITVNLLRKNLSATLSALQNVGKVNVLSRPYILGSNNQTASITVGQKVPIITASRETDLGSTVNTITYEDIGIILEVTPQINPDGLVTLTVKPEISSLTSSTVAISEKVKAPVYSKRSATSRVAIPDGQTIVIGGLMQDEKLDEVKKVPLLGSIPILNLLFSRKTTSNTKTELLIFLTPHVSSNPDSLAELSEGTLEGSTIKTSGAPELFDQHLEEMGKRGPKEGNTIKQSSDPEPFDIQLDEMEKSAPEEKSIKKSDAPEPLNLRLDEKEDL